MDGSYGGEWFVTQPVRRYGPQISVARAVSAPETEVMVKGEGNGCVCPRTKPRSEARVTQRAAALPSPATPSSANDVQEAPRWAGGPPNPLVRLDFGSHQRDPETAVQLRGRLTCSRPDRTIPAADPLLVKSSPRPSVGRGGACTRHVPWRADAERGAAVWLPAQCLSPRSLASLLTFRTSQLMQGTVGGNLQMASTAEVQRAVFLCVDE